jgi:hypothetical protein
MKARIKGVSRCHVPKAERDSDCELQTLGHAMLISSRETDFGCVPALTEIALDSLCK